MKSSVKNIKLASVDDLFKTDEMRADEQRERVFDIPLAELHPFRDHPFKVKDDDAMRDTVDSIKEYGVLVPAIARLDPNGGYELVAGHRRHHACQIVGLETLPTIVRDLDDDESTIIMVDSNLQREEILPSEKAFAYKMKLEALKHQGKTSRQVGEKWSVTQLSEAGTDSERQIHRYIRLSELIPPLLDLVDERKIALNPAYELSFLSKSEQETLFGLIECEQVTPSLSQAQRMKQFSKNGQLSEAVILAILSEQKRNDIGKVSLTQDMLSKYFPKSYTPQRMQETIIKLLEQWQRKRPQEHER